MSENNSKILLIEPHYLPPVAWMKLLEGRNRICLDISSSFVKASYRNRCHILSPNGVLHLSIPLQHIHHERKTVGNAKISYEMNWQKNHWSTLTSCYRRSAYFEYFEDLIAPLYHKKFETLLEFNMAALKVVFNILPATSWGARRSFNDAARQLDERTYQSLRYLEHFTLARP